MIFRFTYALMLANFIPALAAADPGKPVAVRWWGQAMVSIETYWNQTLVIDPVGLGTGYADPQLSADLVLVTHEHPDHNNVEIVRGEPIVVHGLEDDKPKALTNVLDRLPNEAKSKWINGNLKIAHSPNAIRVTCIPSYHDNSHGSERGENTMFLVEVDDVRIVHCGDLGQTQLTPEQLEKLGQVDVLLIPVGGVYTVDGTQAAALVKTIAPRFVVPIHYKTEKLKFDLHTVDGFLTALGDAVEVVRPVGNTLAVAAAEGKSTGKPQVVVLRYEPWRMPAELAKLFDAKEAASRASQEVFHPLSTTQMNFRPGDGTHTPRWNAEHMMARELGFFTEIYHAIDPTIPLIDLNPQQMPPDYQAAHPDWTGAEEARQMERVEAFTRRFAHLLDGVPLDEPAPGSRWTSRGLLGQMQRHYGEHTANVKLKFELPDWPAE